MELRQKIFNLYSEKDIDGKQVQTTDFNIGKNAEESAVKLVVNGYSTKVDVEELFVGIAKRLGCSLKGHSILNTLKLEDGFLIDGENNKYSLWIPKQELKLFFYNIKNPIFSAPDIDLTEKEENKLLDVLIAGIKDAREQQKDEEKEQEKLYSDIHKESDLPIEQAGTTKVVLGTMKESDGSATLTTNDSATLTTSAVKEEEPDGSATLTTKAIEEKESILENSIIDEYIDNGYDCFSRDDYTIFLKHEKAPVLYVGNEKAVWEGTGYDEDDVSYSFSLDGLDEKIKIGLKDDGIIFPSSEVTA